MKKLTLCLMTCLLFACNKSEEAAPFVVVQAMTNGQWKVSTFKRDNTDITSSFSPYQFQFKTNLTVDAINNGNVEKTGTWNASAEAKTITSNFVNASDPLGLLNGTWNITATTWTSVDATMTVNGEVRVLHLDKL